jgi:hypothetical protein
MTDPIVELKRVAMELEAQGHSADAIIDAAFRLAVNTAVRLNGRDVVSNSLYDMAAIVAANTKPTKH